MLTPLEPLQYVLIALAAVGAGAVNALAGGGTLITFPMLTAVGVPAVAANVTNTVALLPGYLGATLAQRRDLAGQEHRLWWALPAGVVGGLIGGILLLRTGERLFRDLVPYLILLASGLLALQDPMRKWVARRLEQGGATAGVTGQTRGWQNPDLQTSGLQPSGRGERWATLPLGLAAIYGGYFGAGLSVIILAVLAVVLDDSLTRLNALKQFVAFATNTAAAVFFLFSGQVVWAAAAVMAVGALIGGVLGGKVAGRVKPSVLRYVVVAIGVIVSIIYFVR